MFFYVFMFFFHKGKKDIDYKTIISTIIIKQPVSSHILAKFSNSLVLYQRTKSRKKNSQSLNEEDSETFDPSSQPVPHKPPHASHELVW